MSQKRLQYIVRGKVQGVGFRPKVYSVATALGLTGFVYNTSQGVCIEVQGRLQQKFLKSLLAQLPDIAHISEVETKEMSAVENEAAFIIETSQKTLNTTALISPDLATCTHCQTELFEMNSRYQDYPFLNCTQCGPRFSIVTQLPYDRKHTAMQAFIMCPDCQHAYDTPSDRRHHAQPNACNHCGPHYAKGIKQMAALIDKGQILAIKGLGGYQFIFDAMNVSSIARLRKAKQRPAKPLAIMLENINQVRLWMRCSNSEASLLTSAARPIVLLERLNVKLPEALAPGLNVLGVMLPSTPLHYLLFEQLKKERNRCAALVVTSGNRRGEPIVTEEDDAQCRLAFIADEVIAHNREIISRVDDSVIRVIADQTVFIRRARGFVPEPISLAKTLPNMLALGAQQKNTICLVRGDEAFVSQHIGDLSCPKVRQFFHETIEHWQRLLGVKAEYLVHDLHPDFYGSQWALERGFPRIAIQHHHAHLASVIAEHKLLKPVLGLALDGYGYGSDGQAWGGELIRFHGGRCEHLGQLMPLTCAGAEQCTREPWRMAASVLHQMGLTEMIDDFFPHLPMASTLKQWLLQNPSLPATSSAGRLFDVAAAILNVCQQSTYEGEAAMRLESLVSNPIPSVGGYQIHPKHISFLPLIQALTETSDPVFGADVFHGTLIAGLSTWLIQHCRQQRIDMVVLSGGCFINRYLTAGMITALASANIETLLPNRCPVNDGGLSLGQAWLGGLEVLENVSGSTG